MQEQRATDHLVEDLLLYDVKDKAAEVEEQRATDQLAENSLLY